MAKSKELKPFTEKDERNMQALGLSPAEYAKRRKTGNFLVKAGLVGLGALASLTLILNRGDQVPQTNKTEKTFLQDAEAGGSAEGVRILSNSAYVLHEGVNVRTYPETRTISAQDADNGERENVAFTVKKGKAAILVNAVTLDIKNGTKTEEWIGGVPADKAGDNAPLADRMLWVNVGEVRDQEKEAREAGKDIDLIDTYGLPLETGNVIIGAGQAKLDGNQLMVTTFDARGSGVEGQGIAAAELVTMPDGSVDAWLQSGNYTKA